MLLLLLLAAIIYLWVSAMMSCSVGMEDQPVGGGMRKKSIRASSRDHWVWHRFTVTAGVKIFICNRIVVLLLLLLIGRVINVSPCSLR